MAPGGPLPVPPGQAAVPEGTIILGGKRLSSKSVRRARRLSAARGPHPSGGDPSAHQLAPGFPSAWTPPPPVGLRVAAERFPRPKPLASPCVFMLCSSHGTPAPDPSAHRWNRSERARRSGRFLFFGQLRNFRPPKGAGRSRPPPVRSPAPALCRQRQASR